MSHLQQLQFYSLKDFVDLTSRGKIGPSMYLDLRNMNGNEIHRISYHDHCQHLCESEDIDLLTLLSAIKKKINEDMIYKSSRSPIFKKKIMSVCNDWSEDNLQPYDLFHFDVDDTFSTSCIKNEEDYAKHLDSEFTMMDQSVKNEDSNLYDSLQLLKVDCEDCLERLQKNLSNLQENKEFYDPKHKNIWSDLSTTQKVSYLNELLKNTPNNDDMNVRRQISKRVNKDIPDEIHLSFMNGILVSTMLHKENELLKKKLSQLYTKVEERKNKLNSLIELYPDPALERDGELTFIDNLQSIFNTMMNGDFESSDEEEMDPVSTGDIKQALQGFINKSNKKEKIVGISDDDSDNDFSDEEIHHLSLEGKPSFYD
jgi:hypothetical protein